MQISSISSSPSGYMTLEEVSYRSKSKNQQNQWKASVACGLIMTLGVTLFAASTPQTASEFFATSALPQTPIAKPMAPVRPSILQQTAAQRLRISLDSADAAASLGSANAAVTAKASLFQSAQAFVLSLAPQLQLALLVGAVLVLSVAVRLISGLCGSGRKAAAKGEEGSAGVAEELAAQKAAAERKVAEMVAARTAEEAAKKSREQEASRKAAEEAAAREAAIKAEEEAAKKAAEETGEKAAAAEEWIQKWTVRKVKAEEEAAARKAAEEIAEKAAAAEGWIQKWTVRKKKAEEAAKKAAEEEAARKAAEEEAARKAAEEEAARKAAEEEAARKAAEEEAARKAAEEEAAKKAAEEEAARKAAEEEAARKAAEEEAARKAAEEEAARKAAEEEEAARKAADASRRQFIGLTLIGAGAAAIGVSVSQGTQGLKPAEPSQ